MFIAACASVREIHPLNLTCLLLSPSVKIKLNSTFWVVARIEIEEKSSLGTLIRVTLVATRDSFTMVLFPLPSCFGYEWEFPQKDTDKKKTTDRD